MRTASSRPAAMTKAAALSTTSVAGRPSCTGQARPWRASGRQVSQRVILCVLRGCSSAGRDTSTSKLPLQASSAPAALSATSVAGRPSCTDLVRRQARPWRAPAQKDTKSACCVVLLHGYCPGWHEALRSQVLIGL